jgi:inhibitor of cysteine peptidase
MSEIAIVRGDRGKTFEVSQGDVISLRLEENPTTGYQWEIDALDEQVVDLQDSNYLMIPGMGVGGGGMRTFTFKARSPGTAQVRLKLRREWESNDAAIDRFEVTLQVRGKLRQEE